MELRTAIELVLNEAEASALGENNQDTLEAVTLLHDFLDWVADDVKMWDETIQQDELHDFLQDQNKMLDFNELSKQEFLDKYPFTTEQEYNITRINQKNQN
jgi:2-polyprenyl-3-methyl-5-hydroxy-6-metoxy-1,4-benzoquinol methylase